MKQVLEFPGKLSKQSSKSVVIGDIFHVYEASALHTISLNAAANKRF